MPGPSIKLSVEYLTLAIDYMVNEPDQKQKASEFREKIQLENGVKQVMDLIKAFLVNPKI